MKTKLVYVLTCAPQDTYIEQALMSVWSARYHNPGAHIVLIVDDLTNNLLVGERAEVLDYISEKLIVPFEPGKNMHDRSRWLKTKARELIKGDFLYIDTDTIIMCDLSKIEQTEAEIAMVRDENVDFQEEIESVTTQMMKCCEKVGVDLSKEKYYFNGGVIYARDTQLVHQIYDKWHTYWKEGLLVGLPIDQPSFAKANIEFGRPVVLLDDRWNTMAFTYIDEIYSAYILHFWRGVSFLYQKKCMDYIKHNGLTDFLKYYVLHPTETFVPSDSHISKYKTKDFYNFFMRMKKALREYGENIDPSYENFSIKMRSDHFIKGLLMSKLYALASLVIVLSKWYRVRFSRKFVYKTNVFKK